MANFTMQAYGVRRTSPAVGLWLLWLPSEEQEQGTAESTRDACAEGVEHDHECERN